MFLILQSCATPGKNSIVIIPPPLPDPYTLPVIGREAAPHDVGVIFEWNNIDFPITTRINHGNDGTAYSLTATPNILLRSAMSRFLPIEDANGGIRMGRTNIGVRVYNVGMLIIGGGSGMSGRIPSGTDTTENLHVPGQLYFSEGTFRLTIDYRDIMITSAPNTSMAILHITINNNTARDKHSLLGTGSIIREYPQNFVQDGRILPRQAAAGFLADISEFNAETGMGKLIITFTPSVMYAALPENARDSLGSAFLGLQCYVSQIDRPNHITLTGIKLERIE